MLKPENSFNRPRSCILSARRHPQKPWWTIEFAEYNRILWANCDGPPGWCHMGVPPMSSLSDWKVSPAVQPKPENYRFDLERTLTSVVGLRAIVPSDAFTAEVLGTERAGNGVLIRDDGVVLTIGYLITEAESVWISLFD